MPKGASITAEAVCFFRAVETARPEAERVLFDPFAERLLPRRWRRWVHAPITKLAMRGWPPFATTALQAFVVARHRYIDDALQHFLDAGGEQVVILGAGYDSRGLRFKDALAGRPLIEVDFPATQERKRKLLAHKVPEVESAATYLPIDFEQHTLEEGLLEGSQRHTFEPDKRTFFVWEGVSMYLRPSTVERTLATIQALSAPGSELACDLWGKARGNSLRARLRRRRIALLRVVGEPIHFALHPDEASAYFSARGFDVRDVSDSAALQARYPFGPRRLYPDTAVAHIAKPSAPDSAGAPQ